MPKIRKTRVTQKKYTDDSQNAWHFCVSIFENHEDQIWKMEEDPMVNYLAAGREQCPTTENVHWQTYVEFRKTRLGTVFKKYPHVAWRSPKTKQLFLRKGTVKQAVDYCFKDIIEPGLHGKNKIEKGKPAQPVRKVKEFKNPHWSIVTGKQ